MISIATNVGFPKDIAEIIEADCVSMGMVVAQILPTEKILLKLDVTGEFSCPRWHQDNYSARAIVSYNLVGTEFLEDANVNFWELKNCGNNDHIVRDASKIFSAQVG